VKFDYRIEGHVNGRALAGTGVGAVDPHSGTAEVEVTFTDLPTGWDPRTIILMCCNRATVFAPRSINGAATLLEASGGLADIGRSVIGACRWGYMRDAAGIVLADLRASSYTDLRDPTHGFDSSVVEGGISHLHPGTNGIKTIKPFTGVLTQAGPNMVTAHTTYEVELEDGTAGYGSTFYPYHLPDQKVILDKPHLLSVNDIHAEFDGVTAVLRLSATIEPLTGVQVLASV
jgi:hypothetical protein